MCDDVEALVARMKALGVATEPVQNAGWGLLTQVKLPGGGKLGIYQPRNARPKPLTIRSRTKQPAKSSPKKRATGLARNPASGLPKKRASGPAKKRASRPAKKRRG